MRLLERETYLSTLAGYAEEAQNGHGRMVLVAGEAGVGKSSLVEGFRQLAASARWFCGSCDGLFTPRPLAPLFDIADQMGGELPLLCRADSSRELLFAALLRCLVESDQLTVLVVEDVHWADEATLDVLRFLGRRIRGARTMLLVTYRDDGLAPDVPLRITLGDLSTQRTTRRMALPPLSEAAVIVLAAEAGVEAAGLYALTGGNPFFVTEVVQVGGRDLPPSIRDAVLARVAGLRPSARHVLDVASLIGTQESAPVCCRTFVVPARQCSTTCWRVESLAAMDGGCASGMRSPGSPSSLRSLRIGLESVMPRFSTPSSQVDVRTTRGWLSMPRAPVTQWKR